MIKEAPFPAGSRYVSFSEQNPLSGVGHKMWHANGLLAVGTILIVHEVWRQGRVERDAEERGEGMGWRRERGGGSNSSWLPFFLSLSLVTVLVSPLWWKSNTTLPLIMWQLEFTYLVNPASGFRFQLISLWLLHSPRGWWEQGGGGEPAVRVRRIQYEDEGGGGAAIHGGQRWRKCLHSTFECSAHGGEIPVCAVREHSAEYFYSSPFLCREIHGACMTAAYVCTSWCLHAQHPQRCRVRATICMCSAFVLRGSRHVRCTLQSMNLCLCFTQKAAY